ncbi:MAG: hypothetical protein J6X30_01285, partial [Clostridia bacterium]|nr:hypothetical protein [Clostridia bacterium]
MKKGLMAKIGAIVAALTLAASCLAITHLAAEPAEPGTFLAVDQTIQEGTTSFDLEIKIGENPGITGAGVHVGYDSEYFTLTKVTDTGALNGKLHSNNYTMNPFYLTWGDDTPEGNNTVSDTVVATMTFTVKEGTPAGKYRFTVSTEDNAILNYDINEVPFTGINGTLTIACAEHTFVLDHNTTDPTCETGGSAVYICSVCGAEEIRDVDPLGHNYQKGEVTAPTCTEQGYTTYVCQNDQTHIYKSDYTDALGHDYQAGAVTNPTCTEQGYTTYVCSHDSSHMEKRDYTDAVGHDFQFEHYTVDPTCETGG